MSGARPGRQRHASGAPWEGRYGYSRAVRVGDVVAVSGTTAVDEAGRTVGADAGAQARYAFAKALGALAALGASAEDVVRTRMYVLDIARDGDAVGLAHAEALGDVRPAATLVEVRALVAPDLLVEVEMDAVVGGS